MTPDYLQFLKAGQFYFEIAYMRTQALPRLDDARTNIDSPPIPSSKRDYVGLRIKQMMTMRKQIPLFQMLSVFHYLFLPKDNGPGIQLVRAVNGYKIRSSPRCHRAPSYDRYPSAHIQIHAS